VAARGFPKLTSSFARPAPSAPKISYQERPASTPQTAHVYREYGKMPYTSVRIDNLRADGPKMQHEFRIVGKRAGFSRRQSAVVHCVPAIKVPSDAELKL
jgi:hypothetical protein